MSSKRTKTPAQADPILAGYAKQIRALYKRLCATAKRTVDDMDQTGELLTKAKRRIASHGDWLPWLDREFVGKLGWSVDTAQRFMRVHELLSKSKNRKLRNLSPSVLYLLARKSMPEAVLDTVAAQVEAGEKVTLKVVKKTVRIESPFYQAAKTVAPATGEAVHTMRPPIPQEAVRSNVQIMSPEYAPPDCEQTRRHFNEVCRLGDSIDEWFAAGDGADDLSDAERETLIKAFSKIKQFVEVLTQAPHGHSSVN